MSEMSVLQRVGNEFDARNLWLQLLLGLVVTGDRLAAILDRDAPPTNSRPAARSDAGEDPMIHCVLGLLAFRKQLHTALEDAVIAPRNVDPASAAPPDNAPPRELLRPSELMR